MGAALIAAQMEETHSCMGQDRGRHARMRGHVGHLGRRRQRLSGQAGQVHGIAQAARQVFQVERFGVRGESQGVRHQSSLPHGSQEPVTAFGRLSGPQDLGHGPASQGPGELLVRRQRTALIDEFQSLVGHGRPIALHHPAGEVGVADIEVRLGNDDHFFEFGP